MLVFPLTSVVPAGVSYSNMTHLKRVEADGSGESYKTRVAGVNRFASLNGKILLESESK